MPWTIAIDHIADPDAPKPSNQNAVGIVGPRAAAMSAAEIISHPQARQFRIRDDDGELYYEGVMVITPADGEEGEFRPLTDFGTPNVGATIIEYRAADGTWQAI